MINNFDYKNFYTLLQLENSEEKELLLKDLIDSYLSEHFFAEDRRWFNTLCNQGLLNLVYHCEKNVPSFTLFDNNENANSFNNVSFFWAIESGNYELIEYFSQHEDFPKFCKAVNIEKSIASFIQHYKERNNKFSLKNYEKIVDFLITQFPLSIPEIFEKSVMAHHNEEITSFLKSFVIKYKSYLKNHLAENENDNLTRYCMISLVQNCFDFADFLKKEFPDLKLERGRVEILLYFYNRQTSVIDWIIDNPNFFILKKEHFNSLFRQVFQHPLRNKIKKEDYDFFFYINKIGLHTITENQMQVAIDSNFTPFVKKYYNQFINHEFNLLAENTCTYFIEKKIKEKLYKALIIQFPPKGIPTKKNKI